MPVEPPPARVVIVDDQRSFADALTLALSMTEDLRVVGVAGDVDAGYELVRDSAPDLVVIDYRLSGPKTGVDLARRIRETCGEQSLAKVSRVPILILTGYAAPQVVRGAESLDAVSVISKDHAIGDLVAAFRRTMSGEAVARPQMENSVGLTLAELEVLELLGQGHPAALIAEELFLSVHAIRARIKSALKKLDVSSQLEAVAKATGLGLIVPPGGDPSSPGSDANGT